MAGTRGGVKREVRKLLRDRNPSRQLVDLEMLEAEIESGMSAIGSEIGLGQAWVTGAVALAAGTEDYSLPSGVEYEQVVQLVRASDKTPLRKLSPDEMAQHRAGVSSSRGEPQVWAPLLSVTQGVGVRVWPVPVAGGTLDLLRAIVPAALTSDASAVPFSRKALRALERQVASTIGLAIPAERRAELGLTDAYFAALAAEAARLVHQEKLTVWRLKRANGRVGSWVAEWLS